MYTAGLVSTSASSTLSETWNVCSVVEPVFRLRNFVWFTGFLCCLRNTHAEITSYGSPSTSTNFLGRTSLYANIRRILFKITYLSTPPCSPTTYRTLLNRGKEEAILFA